ncbi:MAG: PF00070 family, FAD-dependent NAD(P)-disulphide oxidoreductase [uncultured Nocardioidaceae bacterium]|uniref:PF00070 family, FAD-dependent NAD(P)-disulphide oxidoreductase n=1 Tax=uncultured Nocardioidaceae bacterium TaxID=253824 RepID=A0A6J4M5G6_9ACTN|nr:MAG: PF00070 family, FAD-dependent NAD(P)-disulphide oxidoreductase [uncultured Nocardioidaceae bacterium]
MSEGESAQRVSRSEPAEVSEGESAQRVSRSGGAASVDVVVLGLGVGGEDLAARLARRGLSVVAVERNLVGGECPYWGCIPSKMMIRAANVLVEGDRVNELAGSAQVQPDFTPVADRIRDEATSDWDDTVAADRLEKSGARLVRGDARLTGPSQVSVGDEVLDVSRAIVLATGTEPVEPPINGLAGLPYWTNHEALEAKEAPQSLLVLGGGSIGVEMAQAYSRFGTRVTVVEVGERLLAREEPEAGALVADVFEREGITVITGVGAERAGHDGQAFTLTLADGRTLSGEQLLVATGRRPRVHDLGLELVGLDADQPLDVDEHQRVHGTSGDGVPLLAIGDVAGKGAFTHVAMYHSPIAERTILGEDGPGAEYSALPRVTFTDPEVGAVGLTEAQARDAGLDVRTGSVQVPATSRGHIHKLGNDGFIKLVADAERGVLVGATSAGPWGGEVLGALHVAVRGQVPVATLRHSMWAYPTFHRGIGDALADLDL